MNRRPTLQCTGPARKAAQAGDFERRPLDMAILIYEVWEQPDETGKMLPGLVLAGLDGDAFRRILEPGARLMIRFKATSHFQAMTTYYQLVGYGEYFNDEPWSHEPHTQEEADRQA